MAAFFTDLLDGFLGADFLRMVHKKFHYGEEQFEVLAAVAGKMLPMMRKEAFWERGSAHSYVGEQEDSGALYEAVVMSLGEGLDGLQEAYSRKGMLLEAYMLETLAGELLMKSYSAYNRYAMANGTWHVARYHFPGSDEKFPLEILPDILKKLSAKVSCNSCFYMKPKKSVVFMAELTQDQGVWCEGVCTGCTSMNCPNRIGQNLYREYMNRLGADLPLNYGYSRIFSKF